MAKNWKFLVFFSTDEKDLSACTSDNEKAVAGWVLKKARRCDNRDSFLTQNVYIFAVRSTNMVYGVVGIVMDESPIDPFENSILLSILGECALALENEKNAREKQEAAVLAKNDQYAGNLLRIISHDLRTPLTSISGNASNLLSNGDLF